MPQRSSDRRVGLVSRKLRVYPHHVRGAGAARPGRGREAAACCPSVRRSPRITIGFPGTARSTGQVDGTWRSGGSPGHLRATSASAGSRWRWTPPTSRGLRHNRTRHSCGTFAFTRPIAGAASAGGCWRSRKNTPARPALRTIRVETQDINVPACRFYARAGYRMRRGESQCVCEVSR